MARMTPSSIPPYLTANLPGGKVPRRPEILPRVLIKLYRSRKGKSSVSGRPGEENYLASAYADRRDRNVAAADIEGVTTFSKQREYRVLRDTKFRGRDDDEVRMPSTGKLGTQAPGGAVSPAPTKAWGSGAERGMLLVDTETGQVFGIDGIRRDPTNDRFVILEAGAERTY